MNCYKCGEKIDAGKKATIDGRHLVICHKCFSEQEAIDKEVNNAQKD